MGIREELEALPTIITGGATGPTEYVGRHDVLSILDERLPDAITLTREEVREAGNDYAPYDERDCIFGYDSEALCDEYIGDSALCRLCKRLTEFAKEE